MNSSRLSKEQQQELASMYLTGEYTHRDLANKFSVGRGIVDHTLKKLNVKRGQKRLTDEEKIEVVSLYKSHDFTCCDLSEKFGISNVAIAGILTRRGIKIRNDQSILQRKYSLNQNFFDTADSEEKMYFLGLFFADGSNDRKKNVLSITLQERDGYILERLRNALGYGGQLKLFNRNLPHQNALTLSFSSKHISDIFDSLGCTTNKTYSFKFPDWITLENASPFLRGYFDGNGNIYKNAASLSSTTEFCLGLQGFLKKINIESRLKPNRTARLSSGMVFKVLDSKKLLAYLYENSTVHLTRKYDKAQAVIKLKYREAVII